MKVKNLKVGGLYSVKDFKILHVIETVSNNIVPNEKIKDVAKIRDIKNKIPQSLSYAYVDDAHNRKSKKHPIMYLGSSKEDWTINTIDWFNIRKRHWCMYQGKKMLLDPWAVQHFENYLGDENE